MLRTRIITAVVGIPLFLGALWLGGLAWSVVFGLMGLLALYEYLNMMRIRGYTPLYIMPYAVMLTLIFRETLASYCLPLLFAFMLISIIVFVLTYPGRKLSDMAMSFFGAVYIGFLLSYAQGLQVQPQAFECIVLVCILTWSSDVGGYLFGRLWGNRKLTPQLSPNKTWAGAIGGVGLTITLVMASYFVMPVNHLHLPVLLLLGLAGSLAAQFGDLFASAMKRYFEVKDSGYIIPGHGGVLDRFDSFMLVLPVFYYFIYFLG